MGFHTYKSILWHSPKKQMAKNKSKKTKKAITGI